MCGGINFLIFFCDWCSLKSCFYSFHHIWKIFNHHFFKYFFYIPISLLSFRNSNYMYLRSHKFAPHFTDVLFILKILYYLCVAFQIVYIIISKFTDFFLDILISTISLILYSIFFSQTLWFSFPNWIFYSLPCLHLTF